MQSVGDIEIRLLFESDIPAAMKLKEAAGWNQTEDDWRRLLRHEPAGCFAAIKDGQLAGTTTTTTYKHDLGWVGMVLVDPQSRRQGIATKLMETALDYLKGKVATVKLDATPQGKHVYERLGFEVESMVERWTGSIASKPTALGDWLNTQLRRELLLLDERAFDADRSKLIDALIDDSIVVPVLTKSIDGSVTGYALARRGTKAHYVGPVVATQPDQVESLFDQMLGQLSVGPAYIDFNTGCYVNRSALADRGFVKERDLVRMRLGKPRKKTSQFVVGIAGPEIG